MKKKDWILLVGILVMFILFIVLLKMHKENGDIAVVKVEGKIVETLPLNKDTEVIIRGKNHAENTIVVKGGSVYIKEANCPNQYCVHHKKISKDKETIVCLPHKLVIEIHARKKDVIDEK